MITVNSRSTFKDYCMRQLGWPVIEIGVDDDQVEDRVDEAIQYWQQFHYDATIRTYLQTQITNTDKTNKYLTVANNVVSIIRTFPITSATGKINMFDIRYQLRLQDLQTFTGSGSIVNYFMINQHLRLLDLIFNGETPIRFNQHMGRLFVDFNWDNIDVNDFVIIECNVALDMDTYTRTWDDMMLKRYTTALIKRQWGNNMSKYQGVQVLGGITMNGQILKEEAQKEIEDLQKEMQTAYQFPVQFLVG